MSKKKRGRQPRRVKASRAEKRAVTAICIFLALVILGLGSYAAGWYANRARIERSAERYRAMYDPAPIETDVPTDAPAPTEAPTDTPAPTEAPTDTPVPTEVPTDTPAPTEAPTDTPAPTEAPTDTPAPTEAPTDTPAPTEASPAELPAAVDVLIPTADPDTLVYALPTAPPVQESFGELLAHNADTVGFLEIPDMLSLPVVQRENDNDHYLNHNFDGGEALEGTLFLDGMNRLVPEDDCLIIYGHNMKNGTMFGRLDDYEGAAFLREHAVIRFDTLYENRLYVPFAAFTASMDADDSHYFDVRQFIFDETEFELFTLKMQARSQRRMPVDVRYGDHLLLLVTCDYTNRQGRFILGLRQLRSGETEAEARKWFTEMD